MPEARLTRRPGLGLRNATQDGGPRLPVSMRDDRAVFDQVALVGGRSGVYFANGVSGGFG
jgi:hypothetical protein